MYNKDAYEQIIEMMQEILEDNKEYNDKSIFFNLLKPFANLAPPTPPLK